MGGTGNDYISGGDDADQIEHHARVLEEIARSAGVRLAPYPASTIPPRDWVDDCHLSPEGCRKKAAYLEPIVRELSVGKVADD